MDRQNFSGAYSIIKKLLETLQFVNFYENRSLEVLEKKQYVVDGKN